MSWLGSRLRRESGGARFAHAGGPPPAGHGGHAAGAHPHAHHYQPRGTPVGLIVGVGAAAVAVLILVIGIVASRGETPTLAELKAKLGIPAQGLPAGFKVSQVDFMNRLGTPRHQEQDPAYLYFYYDIQEGTAILAVDRGGWEVGEARIRRIYVR
ncbi:MAG TPA: hypothetical protein VNE39_12945 [Planctomycetota bacterium]|nr:hypothetical protein [Planctomycetota bacterium]